MPYEIIRTALSQNKQICYFVYRQIAQTENGAADTYGISASDISGTSSVSDAITDMNEMFRMLDSVSENSVPVNSLNEFAGNYIDSL